MSEYRPVEGNFSPDNARFAIVVSRWNGNITENLLKGALRALARHGVADQAIQVVRVPGAFELPLAAKKVAELGRVDAVIVLGCVIRGGTPHFEYVCSECTRGVGEVALTTGIPIAFGVLTTDDLRQAEDRSAENTENKGEEAALTALEMVSLFRQLQA
ncbi:MAG: 6,7-dimethyl-8-ribityllumazine synthase [Porticoccaceae bacterium]